MLDLSQLRAFLGIIEHGSVGRAAPQLNMTQPALSRMLHRLERQIGARLFDRTTTGMRLTSYGQTLLPYAQLLLAEAANAEREINIQRGTEASVVKIGAVASALESMVPKTLARVLRQRPGLQFRIIEGLADEIETLLAQGALDLAVSLSIRETEELLLVCQSPPQEGGNIVAGVDHPLRARGDGLRLAHLGDQLWALPPRARAPHEEWRQLFLSEGLTPPHTAVETNSYGALRALVGNEGFLGWMPRALYAHQTLDSRIDVLPVQGIRAVRLFSLYRRRRGLLTPPATMLLNELRQTIMALPAYAPAADAQ